MNLNELFKPQEKLDAEIENKHDLKGQDLKDRKALALIVELAETANEGRWFKFWSKDQKARTTDSCWNCSSKGKGYFSGHEWTGNKEKCIECEGTGVDKSKNPLLEEYIDTIHFVITLAMEYDYNSHEYEKTKDVDLTTRTLDIAYLVSSLRFMDKSRHTNISLIFNNLIDLGYQFGFTEERVIAAYHNKNEINHARQENGY